MLRDRIANSFRSQDMSNETMKTRSVSEGFFVTLSLAYASGYLWLGTGAVQLGKDQFAGAAGQPEPLIGLEQIISD